MRQPINCDGGAFDFYGCQQPIYKENRGSSDLAAHWLYLDGVLPGNIPNACTFDLHGC